MQPFSMDIDVETGVIKNPGRVLVRKASDMRGYYSDEGALEKLIDEENDPLHYEVFETSVPEEKGHLRHCISKLQPGHVGNEFFMTKGHYHSILYTAEIYLCLRGRGYTVMKTSDGKYAEEKMERGKMVYIPPNWAHRSVNTGEEPLISFCIYPGEAGHNYGDIKADGFARRVLSIDGEAVIK